MRRAQRFLFRPYELDAGRSVIRFSFAAELVDGTWIDYTDTLRCVGTTSEDWERIPATLRDALLRNLGLAIGAQYWKLHPTSEIAVEDYALNPAQAYFWNELYTRGLGEFFYLSKLDFRGLVSFPSSTTAPTTSVPFPRKTRGLLLNGGGKDSIVSAELLKSKGVEFALFAVSPNEVQRRVAGIIGRPMITFIRERDSRAIAMQRAENIPAAYPALCMYLFSAMLAAALHDYRYVVLSDEQSADAANLEYLGLPINHQWSKSSEAERLMAAYLRDFATPDIVPFSLLRQCSDIELVRQFTSHPKYFADFASCNQWRFLSVEKEGLPRVHWCNRCPKCVFMFACLSAFLPKDTVLNIFGENLYAVLALLPTYRRLLGLEGFKPFECVGVAQEMIVAMHRASKTGNYAADPAMRLFVDSVASDLPFNKLEKEVFSPIGASAIPEAFTALYQ